MAEKRVKSRKELRNSKKQKRPQTGAGSEQESDIRGINHEHERLIQWLKTVKFRKVLIGGVDEVQLWKKLEELNQLYEAAISAERARYDALIRVYTESCESEILQYKQELMRKSCAQYGKTGEPMSSAVREEQENGH